MPTPTQAIIAIEKEMVREFNAGKIDRVVAHFHPRVVGFSSTRQERISGRAAMKTTFYYYLVASPHLKYSVAKPQVQVHDGVAVATFNWTVELGRGRVSHAIHGRGTHVFVRERDKWMIIHEHFSRAH